MTIIDIAQVKILESTDITPASLLLIVTLG